MRRWKRSRLPSRSARMTQVRLSASLAYSTPLYRIILADSARMPSRHSNRPAWHDMIATLRDIDAANQMTTVRPKSKAKGKGAAPVLRPPRRRAVQ